MLKNNLVSFKPIFSANAFVFEDDTVAQKIIEQTLSQVGISAKIVGNGKDGVDEILSEQGFQNKFDIILMDINMPIMDGLTATKILLKSRIKTPIVAVTTNYTSQDIDDYLEAGMSDVVPKPYKAEELWTILVRYLSPVRWDPLDNSKAEVSAKASSVIDVNLGLKLASGDHALYTTLLENFYIAKLNFMESFTQAIYDDTASATRHVHSLRGISGWIGAEALKMYCAELESILSHGEEIPNEKLQQFEHELEATLLEIKQILALE